MKRFKLNLSTNATFNTVTGLTNKTFNPDNIVSGRGATEDQLKVVGDNVQTINDYLDEFGCSDCNEQYAGVRATLDALQAAQEECCENRVTPENLSGLIDNVQQRLDELQAAQEECCDRAVSQENLDALIQDLRDKLNELEARIEECCCTCFDGGGGGGNNCDGSEITVTMSWDPNPIANGGQINATSSGSAPITFYYFLVKSSADVWIPMGTIEYIGKQYSVNGTTGHVTVSSTGGFGHYSGVAIGARDSNGCEGIGVFQGTSFDPVGG